MLNSRDLDSNEWTRFHSLTAFITYQEAFKQIKQAGVDDDWWNIFEHHIGIYLATPGVAHWWQENKSIFGHEFVAYLDSERASAPCSG